MICRCKNAQKCGIWGVANCALVTWPCDSSSDFGTCSAYLNHQKLNMWRYTLFSFLSNIMHIGFLSNCLQERDTRLSRPPHSRMQSTHTCWGSLWGSLTWSRRTAATWKLVNSWMHTKLNKRKDCYNMNMSNVDYMARTNLNISLILIRQITKRDSKVLLWVLGIKTVVLFIIQ